MAGDMKASPHWSLLLIAVVLASSFQHAYPQSTTEASKVVQGAPGATLQNSIDDIDPSKGACTAFLTSSSCKSVKPGEGALAECISDLIAAADVGEADAESVPDDCVDEVYQYHITRSKNINANVPLAKACKADADKLCNSTWLFGHSDGAVIGCLRSVKEKLSGDCQKEVFKVQKAAATDYRADPDTFKACQPDVAKLCASVKTGGGRVQACLREHVSELSWDCGEQLFKQEAEADGDIRLSVRLFRTCLPDKKKFCADAPPGQHAAKDCLLDHWQKEGFSEACKKELAAMVERRVHDFRLDSRLTRTCADDINILCSMQDVMDGGDLDVSLCLQDFVVDIRNEACRTMVHTYQELAAQDIRFDVPLADACYEDRTRLCGNVPPGSARVIRCLQSQRDKLGTMCRATLFDEEVRFSENIDFQYPMKEACTKEIETFCKDVPHGNARVIRCLQENKGEKEFGKMCAKEVAAYESQAAFDYRLNFRLRTACEPDIHALCKDACNTQEGQTCGGTVLRCLTVNKDDIKSASCRGEVFYFEKMEVSDFHNDVILAATCHADVDKFCPKVEPGEGRMHACLREHTKELSEGCRAEELILEQAEAENIELRPGLLKACTAERNLFCSTVSPGQARVFRCLAEHLGDPDFGATCRAEVVSKLQRRQANWKLDPSLRRACRADVADLCREVDKGEQEGGVYHCLIQNVEDLDPNCQKEVGRAVHMAFYIWTPGATLTQACDGDITSLCLKGRPNMAATPGAVGACLAGVLEALDAAEATPGARTSPAPALSPDCLHLADVAEPPNMKHAFEASLSVALLESQLSRLEGSTGLAMLNRDRAGNARGITLTGWTALLGMSAMVLLVGVGAHAAWRQYRGVPDGSTVVLKAARGYKRVATASN